MGVFKEKKHLLLIMMVFILIVAAVPANVVSAASKSSGTASLNKVVKLDKKCYDAYFKFISDGSAKKIFDKHEKSLYKGKALNLTSFAIVGNDGANPYLLLSALGDSTDSKFATMDYVGESTYLFQYDSKSGKVVEIVAALGTLGRLFSGNSSIRYSNLYLYKTSKKYDLVYVFQCEFGDYVENESSTYFGPKAKFSFGDITATESKATKKRIKNGDYAEITWYKVSELSKAKKAYKTLITSNNTSKDTSDKTSKDDRDKYFEKSGTALNYLGYKINSGTFSIEKNKDGICYKFSHVDESEVGPKFFGDIKGSDYCAMDGCDSANYKYDFFKKKDGSYVCLKSVLALHIPEASEYPEIDAGKNPYYVTYQLITDKSEMKNYIFSYLISRGCDKSYDEFKKMTVSQCIKYAKTM